VYFEGLEPRERRTLVAGALVSAVLLVFTFAVMPYARRWSEREAAIAVAEDRVARLRSLAANEQAIARASAEHEARLDAAGVRLLHGRTSALAASALQELLREYARESRVTLSRLDVANTPQAGADLIIPATVSALGDISGLADLLARLQRGTRLVEVRGLTVSPNPALRGELLQITITLAAPYVPDEPPAASTGGGS
jgi:hypothetical protein